MQKNLSDDVCVFSSHVSIWGVCVCVLKEEHNGFAQLCVMGFEYDTDMPKWMLVEVASLWVSYLKRKLCLGACKHFTRMVRSLWWLWCNGMHLSCGWNLMQDMTLIWFSSNAIWFNFYLTDLFMTMINAITAELIHEHEKALTALKLARQTLSPPRLSSLRMFPRPDYQL